VKIVLSSTEMINGTYLLTSCIKLSLFFIDYNHIN